MSTWDEKGGGGALPLYMLHTTPSFHARALLPCKSCRIFRGRFRKSCPRCAPTAQAESAPSTAVAPARPPRPRAHAQTAPPAAAGRPRQTRAGLCMQRFRIPKIPRRQRWTPRAGPGGGAGQAWDSGARGAAGAGGQSDHSAPATCSARPLAAGGAAGAAPSRAPARARSISATLERARRTAPHPAISRDTARSSSSYPSPSRPTLSPTVCATAPGQGGSVSGHERIETCPVSTVGGTRLVRLVRGRGERVSCSA